MLKKIGALVYGLLFLNPLSYADIGDTVIVLEQVVAKGVRFDNHAVGAKVISVDSLLLSNNKMNSLSELLSMQSIVNITSYGPGGQSGIKMRGGSADHTAVIWNGLNLKPPMSGELNSSTICSGIFDDVRIQPGGSSTSNGTGAATGVVHLSNKIDFTQKGFNINLGAEAGSFNTYGLKAEAGYANQKFGYNAIVSQQHSDNNFKFVNKERFGKPIETQQHAGYSVMSVVQQFTYRFNASSQIETDFWYSKHLKEVPSLISDAEPGKTEQRDNNLHFAVNYANYKPKWYLKYRGGVLAFNNEFLGFDTEYYTNLNRSLSIINEIESKYKLSESQRIYLGVNNTIDRAISSSYPENPMRDQLSVFGRYGSSFFDNRLTINIESRQTLNDGKPIPFVYFGGFDLEFLDGLVLKASGSKLYSLPDLNDLYWVETAWAVGNPELKPADGWSSEIGMSQRIQLEQTLITHEITFYRSDLKNDIIWLPVGENNRWTPNNYDGSMTRGIEFIGLTQFQIGKSKFSYGYDYTYTDAKVNSDKKTLTVSDSEEEPRQRSYIPKHKFGTKVQYSLNNISIMGFLQYVGKRYIDEVSPQQLDTYSLLDLHGNYKLKLDKSSFTFYFKLKNLLNTEYKVVEGYAQPPRSVYIGLNYNF